MFHFAAAILTKAISQPGVIFKCFPPFGDDPLLYPQNARLYGVMMEVPTDVDTDFDIDVKWNGDTIFAGAPPTFAASGSIQFIMLDLDAPDTAGPVLPLIFEEITVELLEVPAGGIPAGMKVVVIFDDGEAGGGGGGVTDHGALIGLADDDHPQYLRQAEADLLYAPIGGGGGGGANAAVNAIEDWGASVVGATEDAMTNALTKTAASGWGNSGAFGVGAFPVAKGMVLKYIADPTNGSASAISVGITAAAADQSQSFDTADYSFISYLGGWTIYENGVEKYNVHANTAYSKGEEFEIRMSVDGIVSYWFNGVLKYVSATIAVGTYHADVAISANGGRVPPIITRAEAQ